LFLSTSAGRFFYCMILLAQRFAVLSQWVAGCKIRRHEEVTTPDIAECYRVLGSHEMGARARFYEVMVTPRIMTIGGPSCKVRPLLAPTVGCLSKRNGLSNDIFKGRERLRIPV
jgi:hypothetical protein